MPVIGFLNGTEPDSYSQLVAAFREGLKSVGYVEGQNVSIEYRWAENRYDRLPDLATDLVNHRVAVIAATGGPPAALAAKAATQTIPIVFVIAADPVKLGLVSSFNRPDGNATGVSFLTAVLGSKRLELMRELFPKPVTIVLLVNPNNPTSQSELVDVQAAAAALAQNLLVLKVSSARDIEPAFTELVKQRAEALLVTADPILTSQRARIVELAAGHAIPAIYSDRNFADAGGLMTYGTSLTGAYRQVGVYTGQILKGAKPADLPVIQPTKFELVINLKTAKKLGIEFPPKLLALADEVIE
jgi:putative tryptophan/tyrosine transport system substrate-binding protein